MDFWLRRYFLVRQQIVENCTKLFHQKWIVMVPSDIPFRIDTSTHIPDSVEHFKYVIEVSTIWLK